MRYLILLCLFCAGLIGTQAEAQSLGPFRISPDGCVKAGQSLTISGRGFTVSPEGEVALVLGSRKIRLGIENWSVRRITVRLPKGGRFQAPATYALNWNVTGGGAVTLGRVTFCEPEKVVRSGRPTRPAARDEVSAPSGAPEYVVTAPTAQAGAIATAVQNQGASLLRSQALNALELRLMVFDFPPNLPLAQARQIVSGISDAATVDLHHIYGFAATPRLYAASALGEPAGAACSLRQPVKVGVIDGPVNGGAAALKSVRLVQNDIFKNGEKHVPADHGTAVAALIAAPASAGALQGFASGAQIYSAPAFSRERGGQGARLENVAAALDWLAGAKVRLVNMSFSGAPNAALRGILTSAADKGVVMVAAAGNDSKAYAAYPAGAPEVIAVTAVDARGKLYSKANTGKHIEFSAPGVDLWSAKGGGGTYRSGTSFAAPIVTALIARQAARGPLSLRTARDALRRGAVDLGAGGRDTKFGWGLVQSLPCS